MTEAVVVGVGIAALLFFLMRQSTTGSAPLSSGGGGGDDSSAPGDDAHVNADPPRVSTGDSNVSVGVSDLADAIAHAEGWGVPGAVPTRANNPGDLKVPGWRGPVTGREGIPIFDTVDDGWSALYHQLQLIERGASSQYDVSMTIAEMANHWTATERPEWAANVAAYLRDHGHPDATVDTSIAEVLYA